MRFDSCGFDEGIGGFSMMGRAAERTIFLHFCPRGSASVGCGCSYYDVVRLRFAEGVGSAFSHPVLHGLEIFEIDILLPCQICLD